ncbi:tetratricopeptide repeat protein [Sphingobacterium sp. SYP-B4668]|uniref:tetratricopeptide repeat protein n=1 Tax=Sphingobacterium sp. SYP-B4668 TaxID=2996035 RepID=UPI0022DD0A9C|nr:tetratricopeptide repeat protein [Sphingobacterium sp. SYP-B4668]
MTKSKLFLSLLFAGAVGTASAQSLKDAQAAMEAEQYDKAKVMLENLVQKKPKDGENYFYLGQIYLVNDRVDSAAIIFNNGLTNDPKNIQLNTVGLGIVDLKNNNQAAAEQKFTTATSDLGKKDYLPLYFSGRALIDAPKPDFAKALEYLTQAKAKNAKDALVPLALGDAYAGMNESSLAYVQYRDALTLDEGLLRAKIGQAVITRRAQAYDVAIEQLNALTQEFAAYAPTFRELAETYRASSLKEDDEEKYKAINKQGVDAYKKYLDLTGDKSLEAKIRYADFLVYAREYAELKKVSEELAQNPDVDPKIYRYLGYGAYNQDKDYAKSLEYLNSLFAKMKPERIISRDYLFAGLANIGVAAADTTGASVANRDKGIELLKKAIEMDKDELLPEVAETAFAKYQDQDMAAAAMIFEIPASMPESEYYYDANYYIGEINYNLGQKKVAAEEDGKVYFDKADKGFGVVVAATKQEVVDKYLIPALYYRGFAQLGLDNIAEPEKIQGLFVPSFTKLIEVIKAKPADAKYNEYLVDANNYLGYYNYAKGDNAKAKEHFQATLSINPEDEFAKSYIEAL